MVGETVHVWARALDLDLTFLNVNYYIQEPYDQGFLPNTNVTLGAPKVSFAESKFDMNRPASRSERRWLVRPGRKTVSQMTHLLSKFFPPRETNLGFCRETGSTAKACLLAPKYIKASGCKKGHSCFSKEMPSILEIFAHKILNDDSDINKSDEIQEATRRYLQGKASAKDPRRKDVWRTLRRLHTVEAFPNHTVLML